MIVYQLPKVVLSDVVVSVEDQSATTQISRPRCNSC